MPNIIKAEETTNKWIKENFPGTAALLGKQDVIEVRDKLIKENPNLMNQISDLRKQMFYELNIRAGYGKKESEKMFGKILVTKQTGSMGKKVQRLYFEEICEIKKEFYLSCLVDRSSAKIAFISCAEGGVDIEEIAKNNPKKIITIKLNFSKSVAEKDINKIIQSFNLSYHLLQLELFSFIYHLLLHQFLFYLLL